jgi:hypothetical protein
VRCRIKILPVLLLCFRQYTSECSVVLPQTEADAVALSALVRALAKTDRVAGIGQFSGGVVLACLPATKLANFSCTK